MFFIPPLFFLPKRPDGPQIPLPPEGLVPLFVAPPGPTPTPPPPAGGPGPAPTPAPLMPPENILDEIVAEDDQDNEFEEEYEEDEVDEEA